MICGECNKSVTILYRCKEKSLSFCEGCRPRARGYGVLVKDLVKEVRE